MENLFKKGVWLFVVTWLVDRNAKEARAKSSVEAMETLFLDGIKDNLMRGLPVSQSTSVLSIGGCCPVTFVGTHSCMTLHI